MLTDKQVHEIQAENHNMTMKFIRSFDEEWNSAVQCVKCSGKNLRSMPIVQEKKVCWKRK